MSRMKRLNESAMVTARGFWTSCDGRDCAIATCTLVLLVVAGGVMLIVVFGASISTATHWSLRSLTEHQVDATSAVGMLFERFPIELRFGDDIYPEARQVFYNAKWRWERILINNLDTIVTIHEGQNLCGHHVERTEAVDGMIILVNVANIDGLGNVLANAGPCGLDSAGRVRAGLMTFDAIDLARLLREGTAETVIAHEMGHVLGLGTLWDIRNLIDEADGGILEYKGKGGNLGNAEIGVTAATRARIEADGGEGTARSHWNKALYGAEMMTGFINERGEAPISRLTVRALMDLGYAVNLDMADEFDVTKIRLHLPKMFRSSKSRRLRGADPEDGMESSEWRGEKYGHDILDVQTIALPTFPKTISSKKGPQNRTPS